MKLQLLLLTIIMVISTSTCIDEKCGRSRDNYRYKLQANVMLLPIKASYEVGDTIELSIHFPEEILDINHNVVEKLISLNILHGWWVRDITDIGDSRIDAINAISVLPEGTTIGSFFIESAGSSSNVVGQLAKLQDNSYFINYKFTLDSAGYFQFNFGRFIEDEEPAENPIEIVNECGNGFFEISYSIENYPVENSLLMCEADNTRPNCTQGLSPQAFLDRWGDDFLESGIFIFKVE